jgi:hypothetical protein
LRLLATTLQKQFAALALETLEGAATPTLPKFSVRSLFTLGKVARLEKGTLGIGAFMYPGVLRC